MKKNIYWVVFVIASITLLFGEFTNHYFGAYWSILGIVAFVIGAVKGLIKDLKGE